VGAKRKRLKLNGGEGEGVLTTHTIWFQGKRPHRRRKGESRSRKERSDRVRGVVGEGNRVTLGKKMGGRKKLQVHFISGKTASPGEVVEQE